MVESAQQKQAAEYTNFSLLYTNYEKNNENDVIDDAWNNPSVRQ